MTNSITGMRLSTFLRLLVIAFFLVVAVILGSNMIMQSKEKVEIKTDTTEVKQVISIGNALITFYQPTIKQCGNNRNITYSGEKGSIGSCAVSDIMFKKYCNLYDTIVVMSGTFKGEYIILDRSPQRKNHIDIWKPTNYTGKSDSYISEFYVK
jgi:hypothetical protein